MGYRVFVTWYLFIRAMDAVVDTSGLMTKIDIGKQGSSGSIRLRLIC